MAQILFSAFLDFFENFVLTEPVQVIVFSGVVIVCVWIPFCWMLKLGGPKIK